MIEWLIDDVVPFAGFVLALGVAVKLIASLMGEDSGRRKRDGIRVQAFCEHCAWEGRISTSRKVCARCGSTHLLVVNC